MRRRNQSKRDSRYCYESPLNAFKKSLVELTTMVENNIVCKPDERLTRGRLRKLKEQQNATNTSIRESSPQNSVIVINDSDSETANGENDGESNANGEGDTSFVECISKPSSSVQQKRKSRLLAKQDANRLSVIPLDNDSSVLELSNMQESLLNEENIAPTQKEDDVVELWSCLNKSMNKARKRANYDKINAMYMVDKRPNLRYLECLRINKETNKRKKKQEKDLSHIKTTLELSIKPVKQKALKCLANNKKKRRCDNFDLNLTNNHSRMKKIISKKSQRNSTHKLREIVVDGCNVAMAHTNGKEFSEKGICIIVDYFQTRGHVVKVFLPQHVRRKEHVFLEQLYKEGTVIFTPSRIIDGRKITSYDDRYILKYATSCGGIVISTDQYRDLYKEKPEWRDTIMYRLLIPTFVGDYIMFPEDPLGRFGPNLETFLRHNCN